MWRPLSSLVPCLLVATALAATSPEGPPAEPSAWMPAAWADVSTLELTTDVPGEGPYTFPVWLVVLDDQVYLRLGNRAAGRVQQSRSAPFVGVTVDGHHFDHVRWESVPDRVADVARAMGEKYWSDVFIHWMSHPLTVRLLAP